MTSHDPNLRDSTTPGSSWEDGDASAPRRLLAVLFTDIVGSTELATALGDRRWRELLEQHDAAVRASIVRFGGRVVDTAGDSFFTVFDMPLAAVECALDAIRAVRRLGLRIRAGVHMGECVDAGTTVRGVTVHIGARVVAKAGGGEVLISGTVRDLLAGSALKFHDRGEHVLKGVDGRWRLYAVPPREREDEADLPPIIEVPAAAPAAGTKPRRIVAMVVVAALVVATAAFVMTRGTGPTVVAADSVAMIDAPSGRVVGTVAVRQRPVGVAASDAGIWVANSIDRSISRISKDGTDSQTVPVAAGPTEIAVGRGLVWVANADAKTVTRINPSNSREVGTAVETGNGLADIAFGANAVWLSHSLDGTVWKLDPATGKRLKLSSVGAGVRGIAASAGAVWAAVASSGTAVQLDPKTGAVVRVVNVGRGASAVEIGAGDVWVANTLDGTVSRIDAGTGSVRATIRVGRGPRAIAIARGRVFVANETDGTVSVIDRRNAVATINIHNAPMGLAADGDHVWVSVRGGVARYRGGTLRAGTSVPLESLDPAANFSAMGFATTPVLYDGLVSYKKTGGVEGSEIVPDLVEEIRAPGDDGKTYSFTLRQGLRYSDGSPVQASDVRATFERLFKTDSYGKVLLGILAGVDSCLPAKPCDLKSSVVTDDAARTVVIKLRRPFADFPAALAHPALSILPATASAAADPLAPVPGTGPYRIATVAKDRSMLTLDRNPHFRQRGLAQPDGYVDRIEVRFGGTAVQQVQAVREGRSDWTPDLMEPGASSDEILTEAASQVHLFDAPSVLFAGLNVRVPPFNDVRARRALNYALDRRALIDRWGGLSGDLTCQVLGKNVSGHRPYCPYTSSPNAAGAWFAPDRALAQRLVRESGTAGQSVSVWVASGADPTLAAEQARVAPFFVEALQAIGYRAAVRKMPGDDYFGAVLQPGSTHQISLGGWIADYPAASGFLIPLLMCPDTFTRVTGLPPDARFNIAGYCSPAIDAKIQAALSGDPAVVADRWHQIDRLVTDDAPWVAYATYGGAAFVSKRVGNVLANGQYGTLLSQMWIVDAGR